MDTIDFGSGPNTATGDTVAAALAKLEARLDGVPVASPGFSNVPSIGSDQTPQVGEPLTGTDAPVVNLGGFTLTRRWLLDSTVLNATANLTASQAGTFTFENRIVNGATVLASTSVTIVVAASTGTPTPTPTPPNALTTPSFTGTAQDGQTLTGARGTYTNSPTSYTNQWQRSTDGSTWTNITGATALNYAVITADVGKVLRLTEIATNAAGSSASNASAASGTVAAAVVATDPTTAPVLTRISTAGENPLALNVLLPDDIDHTGNKVRAQRTNAFTGSAATPNWADASLVTEAIQLDENMVEGQDLPLALLTPPMPSGYNAVRMREENADGSVVTAYSTAVYDTLAEAENFGFTANDAAYTRSNGNKTATRSGTGHGPIIRGVNGIVAADGKRYCEFTFSALGGDYGGFGVTSDASLVNFETATDRLLYVSADGSVFRDGSYLGGGGPVFAAGDVMGLVYDPVAHTVQSVDNAGTYGGVLSFNKAFALYPFVGLAAAGESVTLNLTGPFVHTVAGAAPWKS